MRVTRCSFLISCAAVASLGGSVRGQATSSSGRPVQESMHRLSGVVTDSAREPLSGVEITALLTAGKPNRTTRTDVRGRFEVEALQAGTLSLEARRLGYASRTVQVDIAAAADFTSVEIVLAAIPEELQEVSVSAPSLGKLRGFHQRRQQGGKFGRFLDQNDIQRIAPRNASDLFRTVPGVALASTQSGGNAIRIRGCQPMVWVDDQRVPGAELDEVVFPSDIAAIEFYASSAGIPAQYLERGNRLCGLILVWTSTGH